MKDIKLTPNNDIELVEGDLPLVDGLERTIQHVDTGLFIMLGDWILDSSQGINYVLGLRKYPEIMRSQIKNAIKTTYGVDALTSFSMIFDEFQKYKVQATFQSGNQYYSFLKEVGARDGN